VSSDCAAGGALGSANVDYGSQGFAGIAATQDLPEPGTLLLLPLGLAGFIVARRRRQVSCVFPHLHRALS
jgi:hypothetical protein